MVKLTITISLLLWQLFPASYNQLLKMVRRTVYPGQINIIGPVNRAINKDTDVNNLNPVCTNNQQTFHNSNAKKTGNDAGLFTTAFCEIIR